jgi:hypothetical protein
LVSMAALSDQDNAKFYADKIEDILSAGDEDPVYSGELNAERVEYVAGAVAAAWPKKWEVQAKRCNLAAATLRQLIPYLPENK